MGNPRTTTKTKTKPKTQKNSENIINKIKVLHQKIFTQCKQSSKGERERETKEMRHVENKSKMADINYINNNIQCEWTKQFKQKAKIVRLVKKPT